MTVKRNAVHVLAMAGHSNGQRGQLPRGFHEKGA